MGSPSRVGEIFLTALEQNTAAERADYLDQACGGDAALRLRVERLLDAYPHAQDFLAQSAVDRQAFHAHDGAEDFTNVGPKWGPETSLRDPTGDLGMTVDVPGGARPGLVAAGLPAIIGRYRVIRPLGRGGFGTIYLAQDDALRRPVAIKVPNPERVAGPEDVEVYLAEAQVLAQLDHSNIVPVYDVGRTDDGLCYVVSKTSRAPAWRTGWVRAGCPLGSRPSWWRRSPLRCTTPIPGTWCTGTSSRRTS